MNAAKTYGDGDPPRCVDQNHMTTTSAAKKHAARITRIAMWANHRNGGDEVKWL